MQKNYLSHLADRDYTNMVQTTPIVAYLLKPMSFELRTVRAFSIQVRRVRMLRLIEQEAIEYQQQLAAMNKSAFNAIGCTNLCNKITAQRDRMCF